MSANKIVDERKESPSFLEAPKRNEIAKAQ